MAPRAFSAAGGAVQQGLSAFLQPHQIPEHPVVTGLLLDRIHALQPGLDRGDLAADRQLAHPGQDPVGVLDVRLAIDLKPFHGQRGHERLGPLVRRLVPQPGGPFPRAAAAGRGAAAGGDQREHGAVHGRGERVRAERVELGPAQRRPLDRELQRLALHLDHRITQVVGPGGLAAWPPGPLPAAGWALVRSPVSLIFATIGAASSSAASWPSVVFRSWYPSTPLIANSNSGTRRAIRSRTAWSPCASRTSQGSRPSGCTLTKVWVTNLSSRPNARSAARCPAASPSKVKITSPADPSVSMISLRSTLMWSSPNEVPQVATAVGTLARWQAITSV